MKETDLDFGIWQNICLFFFCLDSVFFFFFKFSALLLHSPLVPNPKSLLSFLTFTDLTHLSKTSPFSFFWLPFRFQFSIALVQVSEIACNLHKIPIWKEPIIESLVLWHLSSSWPIGKSGSRSDLIDSCKKFKSFCFFFVSMCLLSYSSCLVFTATFCIILWCPLLD